jgi:hypothetical protein
MNGIGNILHGGAMIALLAEDLRCSLDDVDPLHQGHYRPVGSFIVA